MHPSLYLSPMGREDAVPLSPWERVANGRVREPGVDIFGWNVYLF